ncbi:2-oxo acid dehydrogenase subunit E2 [Bacteriovoracaceae bacterium]|nr:2-oxo acid dehydrogenase subunit E2 [Bacteriovoracaceae bacterium]|tara:strand:- start:51917 stop:52756 length:840 start_codon:yes stop_codon:yes gene_type:complete
MRNLPLEKLKDTSPFRKIAMGTWKTAKDPSVYGVLEIDMQPVLDLVPEYEKKHGVKITPAHLVGKAVAHCMKIRPEINGLIRGNRIWLRDKVTLFYQVNIPGEGEDKIKKATLSGCTIDGAEDLSTAEISSAIKSKASNVRTGKDKEMKKNMGIFKIMPWWCAKYYLNLASFLLYGLNLNLSWLGFPRDPFGSVMITNIGSLGIDLAWAPLCPYTRVPLLLAVGATKDKPWVIDGEVKVRPIMPIAVTFDHRLIDGIHASQMAAEFKKCFANPKEMLLG